MEVYLKELSKEEFVVYAIERKNKWMKDNKYNYSYLNKERFAYVFDWCSKRMLKCAGSHYSISDKDGWIGSFSQPDIEKKELMKECLFHEVWCKCEWIYRIINREREFYESLKGYIGAKTVKEMEVI